jgi:hypothetical protein
MQNPFGSWFRLGVLSVALWLCAQARIGQGAAGEVDFGKLAPPGGGGEFVEVSIRSSLISLAAKLVEASEPKVADLLRSVKLVRVNVLGLDDGNRAEVEQRVAAIRADLDGQGWERIVVAKEKDQDVSVLIKLRGDEAVEGVMVTVLEGRRKAVLANIVGDIRPEKIALLGEHLDIDPLKKLGNQLKDKDTEAKP